MKFFLCLLYFSLVVVSAKLSAQEWIKPLHREILLSGNFGELRATHFHSGIDIRTGGVEGLPVVCVKDGRLVRVSVSPTGYGQALYIEHADGTTSVYGHLQRFIPSVSKIVRHLQYQQESFRVDDDFRPYGIDFRQGDTIAYSGNTGSSGGPHLHFEIRNTQTENTINPLHYYRIRDTKPPVVKMIYVYRISEEGAVDLVRHCPVKTIRNGVYDAGQVTLTEGQFGIGVYAVDYMNDSWNKLGIYKMSLLAAKDTLFQMQVDSCSFAQNCLINEVKDFERYKKKETVYRCFGNYQHQWMGITNPDKGYLRVIKDSVMRVKILLSDIHGNLSEVAFRLKGKEGTVTGGKKGNTILRYDRAHLLETGDCRVEIDSGALSGSIPKTLKVEKDTLSGRDIFVLADREVPLLRKARLDINGIFSEKAVICEVDPAGRKYPLQTRRTEDGLSADIGYLSRYTVAEDTVAPDITYLGKLPLQTIGFKIKDNLSGVATYRVEVNGKWCLFAYDPRVNLLKGSLAEPVFERGKPNEIKVVVTDRAGNRSEIKVKN